MAKISNRYESLAIDDTLESPIVTDSLKRKNLPSSSSEDLSPLCKRIFPSSCLDNSLLSDKMEENTDNLSAEENIKLIQCVLSTLATAESIQKLKDELCRSFDQSFIDYKNEVQSKLDHFESRVFDVEKKMDTLMNDNRNLRTENEQLKERLFVAERGLNDSEQYG